MLRLGQHSNSKYIRGAITKSGVTAVDHDGMAATTDSRLHPNFRSSSMLLSPCIVHDPPEPFIRSRQSVLRDMLFMACGSARHIVDIFESQAPRSRETLGASFSRT